MTYARHLCSAAACRRSNAGGVPQSALTRWYQERFGRGKRARRVGIVALARKLLIALWRYATAGVLPAGAVVKGV